ncbi:hypothetical protein [uncultured Methanolobus sp.]|uniref:hypothetical protein n=1 Tax=uncultured Methanolobus sp. TaxID=218300 RepID=UPI002AAAB0CB|nr:hypothetical protein [uncultured Methanolobus sp.]
MDETIINSLLLIGVGTLDLYYATKFLKDPEYVQKYVETSSKAYLWKKAFGPEKTTKLIKSFLAPLVTVLGIVFIYLGLRIY